MRIRLGTRPSLLALTQIKEIQTRMPDIFFEVIPILTKGDRDKTIPLISREKTDFFTHEIEQALLNGEIDIAVHSAKDLEDDMPEDLVIAAMTRSISPFDCFISNRAFTLKELPPGGRVGTSSRSRKEGVEKYRKDLAVTDIRGNVDERLAQLDRGDFDAIIVAHAALIRLGLEKRISQIIPDTIIKPHPLQGRLAVQIRKERADLQELFKKINEE
ncbi:hydroxymethylbilane synthase [Candidatus Omnitrophota bacterium]